MIKMKSCVPFLVLSYVFALHDAAAMSSIADEERGLLTTTGYSGDYSKIRSTIVQDYECKLSALDSENRQTVVGYLKKILDNVCYPVGLRKLSDEVSGDWNTLVGVINKDHRNEESEFYGFYDAVESILKVQDRNLGLDFSSLFQRNTAQRLIREASQLSLSDSDGGQREDLISTNTLVYYCRDEEESEQVTTKSVAAKLLADVLIRRLVVCLPTYAEVYFWSLKGTRSPGFRDKFRSFEESLDRSLLEMRYEIRNASACVRRNSRGVEQWVLNNFVKIYERLPASQDIKRDPNALLKESVSRIGLTDRFVVPTLERLGEAVLESQRTSATYRERKPFIITYGISPDLIRRYLTSGLGWIVHEVSAYDLQDSEYYRNVVLGQPRSWRAATDVENISDVAINRGWLLDTFMEDGGGRGTFLNSILLIKDSERLLDDKCVDVHGGVGNQLSAFIRSLVAVDCTSVHIPYLGTQISTEHLITIMTTERENVTAGVDTINLKDLRPSLELRLPKPEPEANEEIENTNSEEEHRPSVVSEENVSESPDKQAISSDECKQIMRTSFTKQNKALNEEDFEYQSGVLISILSGESPVGSDDFDCLEAVRFVGKNKNFLENKSPESLALVKSLIDGFIRGL